MQIEFTLNGQKKRVDADPRDTLLSVLREKLELRGSKYGCGEGECGACSVLLNEQPITSCMTLVGQVQGQEVKTVEAMPKDEIGRHLVKAFAEEGAVQCGFCTPGFIITSRHLLTQEIEPGRDQIREALAGNLCRCTGYTKIVDAVHAASRAVHEWKPVQDNPADNTALVNDNFIRPSTLKDVLVLLTKGHNYKLVCGSTDISVRYEHHLKDHQFIDLTGVDTLNFIREEKDAIVIGATTPYTDIIQSAAIGKWAQVLVRASKEVGAVQIQNLGTLGGNLANASPSADAVAALIVLGAKACIRSLSGERQIPVEEIATGPGQTSLANDELITEIIIPKSIDNGSVGVTFFEKLGPRQTQTISIASVSFCGSLEKGRLRDVKIALGAVAPTIIRAPGTEEYLMSGPLTEERILSASEIIINECTPIDDIRGSADYRRKLIGNLLIRGLWPYL